MTHEKISLADLARHVGEEMGASSWVTLDQQKIQEFAHCTGDHQWIHVDPERAARESPFGSTIAHGFLTLSLIAPTAFELLVPLVHVKSVVNYGLAKVRFMNAVRSGARVRNRITLAGVESPRRESLPGEHRQCHGDRGSDPSGPHRRRACDLPRTLAPCAHAHALRIHGRCALRPRRTPLADDLDLEAAVGAGEFGRHVAECERALHAVSIGP